MNRSFLYIAAAALLTAACTEKVIPVTGVTLNPPDALLLVGATITLDATVDPDDATNKTVTWSADDDRVATVNAAGELTAVAPGTATITVTTADGKFAATCAVNVEEVFIPVIYITLNQTSAALFAGETLTLEAAFAPANATNKTVTWSTSDDRIATINVAGEITAVAPGEATITATADNCEFPATCTVTVTDGYIPVIGITLNPTSAILFVGATLTLDAAVEPAEATNKTITWSTANDRIATVNAAGEITAVAPGTVTITATTDDVEFAANCTITVPELSVITMSTQASEVSIGLAIPLGTDVHIDWGDGKENNMNDAFNKYASPYDGKLYLDFLNNYSSASAHNITITGNILNLGCSHNQLTTLDVSRNIELTVLSCVNNQLTTLDVSRNTKLRELYCFMNQLTTLNVGRNTELVELSCHYNQLITLDVSGATALYWLHCYNNQLTSLNVSGATGLSDLYCYDNQLTKLDMSSNTILRRLSCSNNQLTVDALNDLFITLSPSPCFITTSNAKNTKNETFVCWFWIQGNPGTSDCDVSIAREKGWVVVF